MILVVLSALPFTDLFPELGNLGGPLLAVSAFVCALSWCLFVFCGYGVIRRKNLVWALRGFAFLVLLPFAGAVATYEIYARADATAGEGEASGRFAMHDFDGERLNTRWYDVIRNSEGWRSTREYTPAAPGEILTFFIGDSLVFGAVGQDDMIDSILRDSYLSDNHVIYNFGRPGAGLDDYLRVARKYRSLDPRNVLVFLYIGNDIPTRRHTSLWPKACPVCDSLRDAAGRLALFRNLGRQLNHRSLMSRVRPETLAALRGAGLDPNLLNPSYLAWIFPKSPDIGLSADFITGIAAAFEASQAMQDTLESIAETFSGANFCYVLIPFHFQVSQRYVDLESPFHLPIAATLGRQAQDALLAWAVHHHHCMIDLLPAMQAEQARTTALLFYPLDGHLRPAGNAFVARRLHELGLLESGR